MGNTIKMRVGDQTIDVPDDISDAELRSLGQIHGTNQGDTEGTLPAGPAFAKTGQDALETFAPVVGGVGGSIAGGMAGGIPGAIAGGAAGTTAGELAPMLRPYTTGEPAPSFAELGAQAGKSGLFSILTDAITHGILSPAGKWIGRAFTHADEPLPAAAANVQKELEKRGTTLTAGQMEQIRKPETASLAKTAETIAHESVFSRRVSRTYSDQAAAADDILDDMSTRLGAMPDSEVSRLLTNEVNYQFENLVKPIRTKMYQKAYDAMPGPVVPTTGLSKELLTNGSKAHWQKVVAAVEGNKGSVGEALSTPDPSGKLRSPMISLEQAVNMRADLNKLANKRTEDDAVRNTAKRAAAILNEAIDQAVPRPTKNLAGGALTAFNRKAQTTASTARQALDEADQYFGSTQDMFKNKLMKKTMEKLQNEPGKLENVLLQSNSVDTIKAAREAMGEKIFAKDMEPRLAASFMAGSKDNFGKLDANSLWTRMNTLGEESGKAAFGETRYKELRMLVDMYHLNQTRPQGKLGVYINLIQGSMVGAVIMTPMQSGGKAAATLGITLTPWALGHLVANPNLLNSFRRGLFLSQAAGHEVPIFRETIKKLAAVSAAHSVPFNVGPNSAIQERDLLRPDNGNPPSAKASALPKKLTPQGRPQQTLETLR